MDQDPFSSRIRYHLTYLCDPVFDQQPEYSRVDQLEDFHKSLLQTIPSARAFGIDVEVRGVCICASGSTEPGL